MTRTHRSNHLISIATDKQGHQYYLIIGAAKTSFNDSLSQICSMGATVIAYADSLYCGVSPQAYTQQIKQLIATIASYGNHVGIPNLAGSVNYEPQFNDHSLNLQRCFGIVRSDYLVHSNTPRDIEDYDLILVGEPIGKRDLMDTMRLLTVRMLTKATDALFRKLQDKNLTHKIAIVPTSSFSIQQAATTLCEQNQQGFAIDLNKLTSTLSYSTPLDLVTSAMAMGYLWATHPEVSALVLHHYNKEYALAEITSDACAIRIGTIRQNDPQCVYQHNSSTINVANDFSTASNAQNEPCCPPATKLLEPKLVHQELHETLMTLLASPNIADQQAIYAHYDKHIQGRTIIERGHADAGVLQAFNSREYPKELHNIGIAIAVVSNPRFGQVDLKWSVINDAIIAMLSVTAVGATVLALSISELMVSAITEIPECFDNFTGNHPPSNICCVGKLVNVNNSITPHFKRVGSVIVLVGERSKSCRASEYQAQSGNEFSDCPRPNLGQFERIAHCVNAASLKDYILAAKTIQKGGLATALARMTFANHIGVEININTTLNSADWLFTETPGLLLEIAPQHFKAVQKIFTQQNINIEVLGKTSQSQVIEINQLIKLSISEAQQVWENGLRG